MNTTFWDKFIYLCEQTGKKRTTVVREIGISSGNPAAWKEGRIPNMETVQKLADYFKVNPAYFFEEETQTATGTEPGAVSDDNLKFAMFGTTEISDEKLAEIKRYAQYIKDL